MLSALKDFANKHILAEAPPAAPASVQAPPPAQPAAVQPPAAPADHVSDDKQQEGVSQIADALRAQIAGTNSVYVRFKSAYDRLGVIADPATRAAASLEMVKAADVGVAQIAGAVDSHIQHVATQVDAFGSRAKSMRDLAVSQAEASAQTIAARTTEANKKIEELQEAIVKQQAVIVGLTAEGAELSKATADQDAHYRLKLTQFAAAAGLITTELSDQKVMLTTLASKS